MTGPLVLTTDFSEASREAYRAAATAAARFGAPLHVLHVLEPRPFATPWRIDLDSPLEASRRRRAARAKLRQEAAREELRQAGAKPVLLAGDPADAICRYARRRRASLMAMATHGRDGAEGFPLGSVTAQVLRRACCPVLVLRSRPVSGSAAEEFHPSRILAPHDFSRYSSRGLAGAHDWARAFGAEVEVLTVVPRDLPPSVDAAALAGEARQKLEEVIAREWPPEDGPRKAVRPAVRWGSPAVEILREAEESRSDLLVISSLGLTTEVGSLLGSVAERTIHAVRCPVLVVPSRERRTIRRVVADLLGR